MLSRYKDKYISAEEYEELRIKRLEIFGSEEYKAKQSENSKGRHGNKGLHWYNNGKTQTLAATCPEGYISGCLPMKETAKLTHSKSAKNNPNYIKSKNRGYETLKEVEKRIDLEKFTADFITGKNDDELANLYNITKRMCEKYRRSNKLFKDMQNAN